ncbi:protein NAP1 [Prunus yedoensis var. nudiflora]|uniref:Protein NAP1 n=1 Tax=Prunus yedoensis var. nudiflora TaxID=2094558 RepID=A0A314XFU1_PRUYE|nr:protein NAP1 [Prunus yedoensis var. nudiflora]
MVLFFTDQASLLAPNIQMVFSALAFAQCEVIWYFQHVGIASSKSKTTRIVPVDIDHSDPTIGFLLDGMDHLCCLVRKYIAGTLCLAQKGVHSIAVHGSVLQVVFQSVPLPLFQKRDAVLYVESLIESIMGGLEGLINILDSEGGFGALEIQLLPEQAAYYMNYASRVSIPSAKSPKGPSGFPFPGQESHPENNRD